jgi:hypothetical protein
LIQENVQRVLFLGAGASMPLGLPRMDALIIPIAAHALKA